ncbi:hypothetical protein D7D52_23130 [Nocardia yunnanensis]|uniref:DUF8176 domain-containing protein n=1 Tax=Nocardia yunnanensis TaxID=2382165 RepID=A0A386ZF45_9NOCA|nr:hypothetical protein [Nocardia yunnanensis]AYF76241.1 hypothetical protein D7D52_23130 [Nocardia yunnanensis]
MSTTESHSTAKEPVSSGDGPDAYTGRWSDWITGAPAPAAHSTEYDDYDSEYDEFEDDYEPRSAYQSARTAYPGARAGQSAARHALPDERASWSEYGRRPLKRPVRERVGGSSVTERGRQWAVPILGVLAVLAVTAAIAVQIAKVSGDSAPAKPGVATPQAAPHTSAPPPATTEPAAAGLPAGLCPNEVKDGTVRGNGPGSTKSGTDVILALQNRYYVDRSGTAVRAMFAPDATAPSVEQIQAGIDSIPAGTTYCVQIMPGPFDGQHVMVVSEQHPDASKRTWSPQLVITTQVGDATLISAIVPVNEDTPK